MEPFNWITTQKKGEYYYVPTNLYDFFSSSTHTGQTPMEYRNVETQCIASLQEMQRHIFFRHGRHSVFEKWLILQIEKKIYG